MRIYEWGCGLEADDDEDEKLPGSWRPSRPGEGGCTMSLHRLDEPCPPLGSVDPDSSVHKISTPLIERDPNTAADRGEQLWGKNVVFTRFFQIGTLRTRAQAEAEAGWSTFDFAVIKSLGPPEREGYWIIALPKLKVEDTDEDRWPPLIVTHEDQRNTRISKLPGFESSIALARIKERTKVGRFELEEQSINKFVLSACVWLTK